MKSAIISAPGSELERVRYRFELWRKTRKRCTPIPRGPVGFGSQTGSGTRFAPNRTRAPTELLLAQETARCHRGLGVSLAGKGDHLYRVVSSGAR